MIQCAWCKKISVLTSSGEKNWVQGEADPGETFITHTVCRECLEIHFKDWKHQCHLLSNTSSTKSRSA